MNVGVRVFVVGVAEVARLWPQPTTAPPRPVLWNSPRPFRPPAANSPTRLCLHLRRTNLAPFVDRQGRPDRQDRFVSVFSPPDSGRLSPVTATLRQSKRIRLTGESDFSAVLGDGGKWPCGSGCSYRVKMPVRRPPVLLDFFSSPISLSHRSLAISKHPRSLFSWKYFFDLRAASCISKWPQRESQRFEEIGLRLLSKTSSRRAKDSPAMGAPPGSSSQAVLQPNTDRCGAQPLLFEENSHLVPLSFTQG